MEFPEFTCISPSASPTVPQSLLPGEFGQIYIEEISEHVAGVASHFLRFLVLYGIIGLFAVVLFIYFLCSRKKKNLVQAKASKKRKRNKHRRSHKSNVESNVELSKSLGEHENGYKIGNLIVYTKVITGERKDNTVVFEGKYLYTKVINAINWEIKDNTVVFEGENFYRRVVAVKRVPQTNREVSEKEASFLIDCDENVNIVCLHSVEEDKNFVYLALDHCDINLYELVMRHRSKDRSLNFSAYNTEIKLWMANRYPSSLLLKLMRDIVNGLAYLHENEIIHGNIKPHNIFVKIKSWRAMISDMSISKKFDEMSFIKIHGLESLRGQLPERVDPDKSKSMVYGTDLFELGCVFFFCISGGHLLFDDDSTRVSNILRDKKKFPKDLITNPLDLSRIEGIPEAKHLIASLLDPNPLSRPNVKEVRIHPLLWDSKIKLSFLTDASYRLESEFRMNANSTLLQELEKTGKVGKWRKKMNSNFVRNITTVHKPKVYQFGNVRNLLLLIRKASSHYYEYPKNIQEILGTLPEEFVYNFSKIFPNLLMAVYTVIKTHCKDEQYFRKYFTAKYVCPPI